MRLGLDDQDGGLLQIHSLIIIRILGVGETHHWCVVVWMRLESHLVSPLRVDIDLEEREPVWLIRSR